MNTTSFSTRLQQIWHSYRSLPLWVQVWVGGILVPANGVSFLLLNTWSGQMAAIAAAFVVATNVPIMYYAGGMSRLMSLPHLMAWIPLHMALIMRLTGKVELDVALNTIEYSFIIILLIINSISLFFDTVDTWHWLQGKRDIPGY